MKLRALILLFSFCSLLNDSSSFTDSLASLFRTDQTCSSSSSANEKDHSSSNAGSNEESCCSSPVSSVYLVGNGFIYCPSERPAFKHLAYVVNHYRTSYLSIVWRPPAIV